MSTSDPRAGTHYQVGNTGYFALIGSQRSGSNFFREVVCTNTTAVVHGEMLWPYPLHNVWHNFLKTVAGSAPPPIFDHDATKLVDDYFVYLGEDTRRGHPHKAADLRCIGVDLKYNQLRYISPLIWDLVKRPFLFDYFKNRRVPIVHMLRRNIIQQALSLLIAQNRNVYHNYGGKKFEGKLELAPDQVVGRAFWLSNEINKFREHSKDLNVLEVYYEDVAEACAQADAEGRIDTGCAVMAQIADFIGVPNQFSNPSTISRVINRPYAEIISNHKAVVKAIKDSQFGEFAPTV